MKHSQAQLLDMAVPPGWHRIDTRGDRKSELDAAVARVTEGIDRDSAPALREKIRRKLAALLDEMDVEADNSVLSLLFPVARTAGIVLPVTVALATIPAPDASRPPIEVLVGASLSNPTAQPVPVADTVALRTHSIRTLGPQATEQVADLADGDAGGVSIEAFSLRTQYVFGWNEPTPEWYAVQCSAVLPSPELTSPLVQEFNGLFDVMVAGISRPEGGGA